LRACAWYFFTVKALAEEAEVVVQPVAAEAHPLAEAEAVHLVVAVVAHTLVRQAVVAGEGLHICPVAVVVEAHILLVRLAAEAAELDRPAVWEAVLRTLLVRPAMGEEALRQQNGQPRAVSHSVVRR
jgi:hypothetical protein